MAVIEVEKLKVQNPATLKADGKNTYTEVYRVVTDNSQDGPIVVAQFEHMPPFRHTFPYPLLHWQLGSDPVYYSPSEFDFSVRLTDKRPTRKGDRIWEVACSYESGQEGEDNPLRRPVKWSMSFAAFTRIATNDIFGKAVLNSAGMPNNPPIEIDDSRPIVRAIRNEPSFSPARARRFKDTINQREWKGLPPKTAKVKQFASGDLQEESEVSFYAVTYEFELAAEGEDWIYKIQDAGFYEKGPNGELLVLRDKDGNSYQEPILLDGEGHRLPPDADPVIYKWNLLKLRDFNELKL